MLFEHVVDSMARRCGMENVSMCLAVVWYSSFFQEMLQDVPDLLDTCIIGSDDCWLCFDRIKRIEISGGCALVDGSLG